MKKITGILIMLVMIFSLAACGRNSSGSTEKNVTSETITSTVAETDSSISDESIQSTESETTTDTAEGSKILIVYFSWSGNTRQVANTIQVKTDADIFEIIPSTPYSDDYNGR